MSYSYAEMVRERACTLMRELNPDIDCSCDYSDDSGHEMGCGLEAAMEDAITMVEAEIRDERGDGRA